jgi:hypothetical protein
MDKMFKEIEKIIEEYRDSIEDPLKKIILRHEQCIQELDNRLSVKKWYQFWK